MKFEKKFDWDYVLILFILYVTDLLIPLICLLAFYMFCKLLDYLGWLDTYTDEGDRY